MSWIWIIEFPPLTAPGSREYDDLIPAGTGQRHFVRG